MTRPAIIMILAATFFGCSFHPSGKNKTYPSALPEKAGDSSCRLDFARSTPYILRQFVAVYGLRGYRLVGPVDTTRLPIAGTGGCNVLFSEWVKYIAPLAKVWVWHDTLYYAANPEDGGSLSGKINHFATEEYAYSSFKLDSACGTTLWHFVRGYGLCAYKLFGFSDTEAFPIAGYVSLSTPLADIAASMPLHGCRMYLEGDTLCFARGIPGSPESINGY